MLFGEEYKNLKAGDQLVLNSDWSFNSSRSPYYGIKGDVFEIIETTREGNHARLKNPRNGYIASWVLYIDPDWILLRQEEPFTDEEMKDIFV